MQAARVSYIGAAQHQKTGRCATISNPTLDRLKLRSMVSQSIVWWIQAAQASYSGKAHHHKQGRCATISIPILDRPSLHSTASYTQTGNYSRNVLESRQQTLQCKLLECLQLTLQYTSLTLVFLVLLHSDCVYSVHQGVYCQPTMYSSILYYIMVYNSI